MVQQTSSKIDAVDSGQSSSQSAPRLPKIAEPVACAAVVYIRGLSSEPGFLLNAFARRLATAFDNVAPEEMAVRATEERTTSGHDGSLKAIPLLRRNGDKEEKIADVNES